MNVSVPFKASLRALLTIFALGVVPVGASTLKSDEAVILFPALAARESEGWKFEVHGIVYEPEQHRLMTRTLRRLFGFDDEDLTSEEKGIFDQRCCYFLVDNERGKKFAAEICNQSFSLGESGPNGHF